MIRHIAQHEFEDYVIKTRKMVLVDFWAPWCGPCKTMEPILENLANKFQRDLDVIKVNVDDEQDLARVYGIQSIPTLLVFFNGEILTKKVGIATEAELEEKLKELAKNVAKN